MSNLAGGLSARVDTDTQCDDTKYRCHAIESGQPSAH